MLGQTAMDENVRIGRAAFFLGVGVMGAIAGMGIGSKSPNKLALLISAGSLIYANHLNPVFKPDPHVQEQFRQVGEDVRRQVPSFGQERAAPGGTEVRFRF